MGDTFRYGTIFRRYVSARLAAVGGHSVGEMIFTLNAVKYVLSTRCFSTASCLCKSIPRPIKPDRKRQMPGRKKTRIPFDKRFPVTGKHVKPSVPGGSADIQKKVERHDVPPIGIVDPHSKQFHRVPEMTPEFVVPDLTGFNLKPYVSYTAPAVTQSEFTAKALFNACYADKIADQVQDGKTLEEVLDSLDDKSSADKT